MLINSRSRCRSFAAALVILPGLWAADAPAATIPGVPEAIPSDFSGLRQNAQLSVIARDPTGQNPGTSATLAAESIDRVLITDFFQDTLDVSVSGLSTSSGTSIAATEADGVAAFGALRGTAALNLTGGPTEAHARVVVEFWDLLTFGTRDPTIGDANFDITWDVDGVATGGAFAIAELFVIDARSGISQFQNQGTYRSSTWTSAGVSDFAIGFASELILGNQYWLYGKLRVEANRAHNFNADDRVMTSEIANFMSTAQVFIDAAPDRPDLFVTSASGFDYRTPEAVPEPSNLVLSATALLCFLGWSRLRQLAGRRGPAGRALPHMKPESGALYR